MRAALIALALLLATAAPAAAAPKLVKIGDFAQPVYVTSPPNDSRVFVVEKEGLVKIVGGGTFLDVRSITGTGEEKGLLSIAFPPNYAASGLFYAFLTAAGSGDLKILEFQRSANPNRAIDTRRREFLSILHGPVYHNGGQLQFGPDGMLYISTGDGHDSANAQNTGSLLGKILRLDPTTGLAAAGNPHGRVWSYGLRNPWRFSFDRVTGDMSIADVGDTTWEEVDWAPAPGRGRDVNFGWPDCEGPAGASPCGQRPIASHNHSAGWCAIVGGYVVRDPGLPTLNGRYIYGDNCHSRLQSLVPRTGAGDRGEPAALDVPGLSSFGEDACGHVYAASLVGPVYRIQDGALSACTSGPPSGSGGGADTTAPRVTAAIGGLKTALKRHRLRLTIRCSEACHVAITTRLRHVRRLKTARRTLAAHTTTVARLKLSKATVRRLRAALERHPSVRVSVSVRVTDTAGNARRVIRRARLKR